MILICFVYKFQSGIDLYIYLMRYLFVFVAVSAVVEYDYTANEPDELDLVRGAIIHNIKQMPGGWWEGTLQSSGRTGMFPDNFVRVVDINDDNTVILRLVISTSKILIELIANKSRYFLKL